MKKVQAQFYSVGAHEATPRATSSGATRYIRLPEVLTIVPMSASSVWRGVRAQTFPAPIKLGPRITAWKLSSIEAFLAEREAQ